MIAKPKNDINDTKPCHGHTPDASALNPGFLDIFRCNHGDDHVYDEHSTRSTISRKKHMKTIRAYPSPGLALSTIQLWSNDEGRPSPPFRPLPLYEG